MDGFEKICHWLDEGDCELYTLNKLHQKIEEMGAKGYTNKHLKHKLQERYGDHIYFTEDCGRANIVCCKEFANFVVQEKKKQKEETKKDTIKAAAKIIRSEIREVKKTNDFYPTVDEIQNINEGFEWIPESLKSFLEVLIPNKVKQVSLGQCITQAARSRSLMCPAPFGVGIQLDKTLGSKWLTNHLAKLGLSITSDKILRFKHSALEKTNDLQTDIDILHETQFIQWSGDNVDHNLVTLTGKDTFHSMGIIEMTGTQPPSKMIRRLKYRQRSADFGKKQSIPIHYYLGSSLKGLAKLHLQAIRTLQTPITLPVEVGYDFLWYSSIFVARLTPNWSGFMQDLTGKNVSKQKDHITFLPIIDMSPNDEHCIYSTLIFIIEQAKQLNVQVP